METENSSSVISFGAKFLYQKAFALTTFSQPETEFKQVLGGANVGGIIDLLTKFDTHNMLFYCDADYCNGMHCHAK
jgi:hypothetical protein